MLQTIVFDLDDTLYPKGSGLMEHVATQMILFLQKVTNRPLAECQQLRQQYYRKYGTTLAGLQAEYNVDREAFMRFVHSAHPREYLQRNHELDAMLGRLPQTKLVFTNGPSEHAEKTLAVLGIRHHFAEVLDLRLFDWQPKPTPRPYELLMQRLSHNTSRALYVDDRAENLEPAANLGLQTVLIGEDRPAANSRHRHINHILEIEWLIQGG